MRKNDYQNQLIETYINPAIPDIVQNHTDQGKSISYVNMNSVINIDLMATNIFPTQEGYDIIGKTWAKAITSKIEIDGTGLPERAILRARGSLDRNEVTLTFSKSLPPRRAEISNFQISRGLEVLSVELDGRDAILRTTEQSSGKPYRVSIEIGANGGNKAKFVTGWRMLVLSDWHLGEKYVFNYKPDEVVNDITIINHLKKQYGGDLILIPGDTNAGFWAKESFREEMSADIGYPISQENAVLEAGKRCYKGLLSSFRHGGYWKVLVAFGDHEAGAY